MSFPHYSLVNVFKDVPHELLDMLVRSMDSASYVKGDYIYEKNDAAENFYIVKKGKALLQQGSDDETLITLGALKIGYCFGWSSLFPDQLHKHSVVCAEPCQIAFIKGADLLQLLKAEGRPGFDLLFNLCRLLKDRLDLRTEQLTRAIETHPQLQNIE